MEAAALPNPGAMAEVSPGEASTPWVVEVFTAVNH